MSIISPYDPKLDKFDTIQRDWRDLKQERYAALLIELIQSFSFSRTGS